MKIDRDAAAAAGAAAASAACFNDEVLTSRPHRSS